MNDKFLSKKVQILRPNLWYKNKIAETFSVKAIPVKIKVGMCYQVILSGDGEEGFFIRCDDCEEVSSL